MEINKDLGEEIISKLSEILEKLWSKNGKELTNSSLS